jgi:uncharacterized protein
MANSAGLHEDATAIGTEVIDRHRAIASLQEELEAIDWYDQRIAATSDASLAAILAHNRDEEKEHAAMVLEWLRRHDPVLDQQLRRYLFTEAPVTEIASSHEADQNPASPSDGSTLHAGGLAGSLAGSLGIGNLKGQPS